MKDIQEMEARRQYRRANRMSVAISLREKKEKERKELSNQADSTFTREPAEEHKAWSYPTPVYGQFNPDILSQIEKDENYHPQVYCPLFRKLPVEIRYMIYEFVFLQYEVKSKAYSKGRPYYRPGSTAPKRIDTALLYTCRLVLLEARKIPLETATHEFWCDTFRPAHVLLNLSHLDATVPGLRDWHVPHMQCIHVNTSAMDLFLREGQPFQAWGNIPGKYGGYKTKFLTFCIGFTDWPQWQWGQEPQLDCLNFFNNSPLLYGLQEFTLRLETMEVFKEDLDDIVEVLMEKKLPLSANPDYPWHLSADGIPTKVTRWTGPHSIYLKLHWKGELEHLGPEPMKVNEISYYMVDIKWRKCRIDEA